MSALVVPTMKLQDAEAEAGVTPAVLTDVGGLDRSMLRETAGGGKGREIQKELPKMK